MPFNKPIPEVKDRGKPSVGLASLVEAEKLMQIALLLPCSAFVGWLVGAWLDSLLHQKWMGITGIIFGGVSGLVYVVRLVMATEAQTGKDTKTEDGTGKGSSDQ